MFKATRNIATPPPPPPPLDGIVVHHRLDSGERDMLSENSCLGKQHDDRDQASNHQPVTFRSEVLRDNHHTTGPPQVALSSMDISIAQKKEHCTWGKSCLLINLLL